MINRKDFSDRINLWASKGGKWAAVNPDHNPGDATPEGYEYHTTIEAETVMGFTIYAVTQGQQKVIWKGFHYWNPVENRSNYLSVGTGSEVCNGNSYTMGHDMYFGILYPDGRPATHILNHDDIIGEDEVKSSTQVIVNGQWQQMKDTHWKRI
jgi:hypothetical protein